MDYFKVRFPQQRNLDGAPANVSEAVFMGHIFHLRLGKNLAEISKISQDDLAGI